jgi:hypothetical protein
MPHAVEVGRQIDVNHLRLAPENGLRHPCHGVVRVPPRSVAVRAVVKVRLEDRLHDKFERPLHHPVPNPRDPEHADFRPLVLRNLDSSVPLRPIGARDQFVPELRQKRLHARRLDRLKRDAIQPRRPVLPLGEVVCRA